jgi:hypothetical protein
MKIISCGHCGTMWDTDRIIMEPTWTDEGIANTHMAWYGNEHVPTIHCPVCDQRIEWDNGDTI